MAQHTKQPHVLREIFESLGHRARPRASGETASISD